MANERLTPLVLYIERISKNIKRIADAEMKPYGLRSSHVVCILQLAKVEGGLSSTALAEACGVDKAFISRVTAELIEKGYITKEENSQGKYKAKFLLTESGEKINKIMLDIVKERVEKVHTYITPKKLEIFYEILAGLDTGIADLVKGEKDE